MSTLRSLKDLDDLVAVADSEAGDEFSIDSLRTHFGNIQVHEPRTTRPPIPHPEAPREEDPSTTVSDTQDLHPTVHNPLASYPKNSEIQSQDSASQSVSDGGRDVLTSEHTSG